MIINPNIKIYHHRAQIGGLRVHKARVTSRADARGSLNIFNVPSITELYLPMKYFDNLQMEENKRLKTISMIPYEGNVLKTLYKSLLFLSKYGMLKHTFREAEVGAQMMAERSSHVPPGRIT